MDPDHDPAADPPAEPDPVDVIREAVAVEQNNRAWLGQITRLIEAYSREPERDMLTQTALDTLIIAACERGKRILRSDLGGE